MLSNQPLTWASKGGYGRLTCKFAKWGYTAMCPDLRRQACDDRPVGAFWINDPSRVFVARHGRHELTTTILTADDVRELVERMLKSSGRRLDVSQPFVDAMLPGGHRLHVVREGISRGFAAVNVRKFVARAHSLSDLVTLGSMSRQASNFLVAAVAAGLNVVVSGGTQAGNKQAHSPEESIRGRASTMDTLPVEPPQR